MSDMEAKRLNLDRLHAGATPGPWEYAGERIGIRQVPQVTHRVDETTYEVVGIVPGEYIREEDAEVIAATMNAWPEISAELRESRERLARVEALAHELSVSQLIEKNRYATRIREAITGKREPF